MAENKSSKVMQDYEKVNRLIDGLTLFDDDLMSRVLDRKSTRLNSSHRSQSRMPSSA